jgi:uncharacterized protein involved in type VI secretion and phage assembly
MNTNNKKHYGLYRANVIQNIDPYRQGRIQIQCADVLGLGISSWAQPCLTSAGIQAGTFMVPNIGSGVWVQFEQGDADHPVWLGGYWGSAAEVPAITQLTPPALQAFVVQTLAQNTLMLSDTPGPTGGFLLKTTTGAMIMVNDTGITISNGKGAILTMIGPAVTINAGALVVT